MNPYYQEVLSPRSASFDTRNDRIERLEKLAATLDSKWRIPGTSWRLGLDSVIGMIPGIGDTLTAAISTFIIREAHKLGVPFHIKCLMGINIFVDWLIGLVPLVGDILDVGYKSNLKNLKLTLKHAKPYYPI